MTDTVMMPNLGVNMEEGTFLDWKKQPGEPVKQGEVLAEVEADKATIEIESPFEGVLREQFVKAGQVVKVGQPIAIVGTPSGSQPAAPAAAPVTTAAPVAAPVAGNGKAPVAVVAVEDPDLPGGVKASPLARRIADERGIDLRQVRGTGPGGRIVRSDVETYQPTAAPAPAAPLAAPVAPTSAPAPAARVAPTGDDVIEEPISRMRQRIAARTVESKQTIPHFYVTVEIDMGPALALRKQINEGLPDDQKVTVNDLIVKAVALTLRKFPNLNSHYYGDKIIRHKRVNIGIAVAMDGGGLVNVVSKDADMLSISRLAQRNKEVIAAGRSGKFKLDDIEGATFTISNLGPYDVEEFAAIISPPEAGILAVATARQVPVVINGEIKIATRMKATLSVDHRVSDGAEGAAFLKALRELLEQPMRLLV